MGARGIRTVGMAATGLLLAACAASGGESLTGTWIAEDIAGGGVVDRARTAITFEDGGKVNGSGGCNRFAGTAEISGDALKFGPLASTKMACPPALMNQEDRFFQALAATRSYRIDAARNKLILLGAAQAPLATLARE